jgi:hypothetical protein
VLYLLSLFLSTQAAAAPTPPAADARALDERFEKTIRPFLEKHCLECHSGERPKGELALEPLLASPPDVRASQDRADTWFLMRQRAVLGEMPPKKHARPAQAEIDAFSAWVVDRFARDANGALDPGRPTLRRLNRAEYSNTIRDLLGIDFDAAAEFPSDDVGYGFDNIGDVLSMPDILLEKYLAAAERIATKAILVEDPEHPPSTRMDGAKLNAAKTSSAHEKVRALFANGEIGFDFRFPRDGEYVLRARVWGDQAGPDPVSMSMRVEKSEKARFDVKAVAKAPEIVETRVKVEGGRRRVAVAFLNDYYKPDDPDPKNRDRNLIVEWLEVVGPVDPAPMSAYQHTFLDPRTRGSQRDVIAKLVRRAWRRPATDDEVERLTTLAQQDKTFEEGVRTALEAILVSPNFLFRVEQDRPSGASIDSTHVRASAEPAQGSASAAAAASASPAVESKAAAAYAIDDFELATRLSYFLWSSTPDAELDALADAGKLHDSESLRAAVHRMLRDARSSALAKNFAAQWLQTRNLDRIVPSPEQFPDFDSALAAAMRAESEMFFDAVLREDRSVFEFLDSDFTFVNERLARHYGLAGVRGSEMRRVHLERGARGGVLGQAAVLTVTSNPTRTSPVKRGKWILDNLLGAPTPPPPPGVGVIDESAQAAKVATVRERLEQHRAKTECAACHARLDPLGFGLENFDATGAWRTTEGDHPVDATGELPDGAKFDGPAELKAILMKDSSFVRCLAQKLMTYALGRGVTKTDEIAIEGLVKELGRSPTLEQMVQGIVATDAFRMRGAEKGSER